MSETSRVKVLACSLKMPFTATHFAMAFGEIEYFALVKFWPVSLLILCQAFCEEWVKSMSETDSFHLACCILFNLFTRFVAEVEISSGLTASLYSL